MIAKKRMVVVVIVASVENGVKKFVHWLQEHVIRIRVNHNIVVRERIRPELQKFSAAAATAFFDGLLVARRLDVTERKGQIAYQNLVAQMLEEPGTRIRRLWMNKGVQAVVILGQGVVVTNGYPVDGMAEDGSAVKDSAGSIVICIAGAAVVVIAADENGTRSNSNGIGYHRFGTRKTLPFIQRTGSRSSNRWILVWW